MTKQSILLIDRNSNQPQQPFQGRMGDFVVNFHQLTSGLSAGVWRLEVQAGPSVSISILPTRGMSVEAIMVDDFRFGWQSPIPGPVHPAWVSVSEPSGLGFLDGFDELLVRCGLTNNGAPQHGTDGRLELPLHGRIGNLPAQQVEIRIVDSKHLEIISEVDEVRFHFQKWRLTTCYRLAIGSSQIEVVDTVTNLAGKSYDCQMLYHFNIGLPLLDEGSRIHAPLRQIVPRNDYSAKSIEQWDHISAPQPNESEQVYFCEPLADSKGRSIAVVVNAAGNRSAAIEYEVRHLPCFSIWKNLVDPRDGYVIGLEPATNFPNPKRFEAAHQRTIPLAPGQSVELNWAMIVSANESETKELIDRVGRIQGDHACQRHGRPLADWVE